MFQKRKKEYKIRRCWTLFDRTAYHWAWVDKKLLGILGRFGKDLKYCRQRIVRGYCDGDLFSIHGWFLDIVPAMLEQYKQTRHGSPGILGENYTDERGILVNDTCHEEWDEILARIIFLFHEADETTCQRKNPYEDEHIRILEEFDQKYGLFGEGLETPEEKEENKETGAHMIHFPSELPEYADIEEKYRAEDENLKEYREQCKDEAFKLFSKWFFHLWD